MNSKVSMGDQQKLSIPKAVREASNTLRHQILEADQPDLFLGSEEELLSQLAVSRPTFRQVARLLEQEQLLTIKRGPGGGYFSRQPSFSGVTHLASVCLVAHKAKFSDLYSVGRSLSIELAIQAANNPDATERGKPLAYIEQLVEPLNDDVSGWVKSTHDFTRTVLDVANNPALTMFVHITRQFAIQQVDSNSWIDANDMSLYGEHQRKFAEAIKQGDADYAAIAAARMHDLIHA